MGAVSDGFNQWLRDYVVDGVPASGVNMPDKSVGRGLGSLIEAFVASSVYNAVSSGGPIEIIRDITAETATVVTGAVLDTFRAPHSLGLLKVRASLATASSSGPVTVQIYVNGAAILSTALTIDATKLTSVSSSTGVVISNTTIVDDDEVVIAVTAAGTGAQGLRVGLIGLRGNFGAGAMPIFVAAGTRDISGGHASPAYPAGGAIGDIAIVSVMCDSATPESVVFIAPSGFTLLGGPAIYGRAAVAAFWRQLDGTEGAYATPLISTGDLLFGDISLWRGCVGSGAPFEALALNAGHGAVMSGQAVLTTGDNRLAITIFGPDRYQTTLSGTGWTQRFNDMGYHSGGTIILDSKPAPFTGSVPAESRTLSADDDWATLSFALLPGP